MAFGSWELGTTLTLRKNVFKKKLLVLRELKEMCITIMCDLLNIIHLLSSIYTHTMCLESIKLITSFFFTRLPYFIMVL